MEPVGAVDVPAGFFSFVSKGCRLTFFRRMVHLKERGTIYGGHYEQYNEIVFT